MAYMGKAIPVELVGASYAAGGLSVPMYISNIAEALSLDLGDPPPETAAGQVDGYGIDLYNATNTVQYAFEVNADMGNHAGWGTLSRYVAAIKGNFIIGSAPGGNNTSVIGVLGKLNTNTVGMAGGDKYAVRGHIDFWGSSTLTGTNVNVGALSAYVENEATTTVASGSYLSGLCAYQVGGPTVDTGGYNPAIWVRANTASAAWQYGLYIPKDSAEIPLQFGALGQNADGSGLSIADAVRYAGEINPASLVKVFADTDSTAIYGDNATIWTRNLIGTTQTISATWSGIRSHLYLPNAVNLQAGFWNCVRGYVEMAGATTLSDATICLSGLEGYFGLSGTVTIGAAAVLAGVKSIIANEASGAFAGNGKAVAFYIAPSTINWTHGIYIPEATCNTVMQVGTRSSAAQTGHHLVAAYPVAMELCFDDNNATLGNAVYMGTSSRVMLFHDQSGVSLFANRGQLKLADNVDLATGIYSAVQGYVETMGTHAIQSGATFSTIDSSTEITTTLRTDSGGEYYGVHVETTGAGAITDNGICAALGVTKATGAASWPVGLYIMPNTTNAPIQIGEWISNTADGSVTYGHSLNGAATDGAFRYAVGAFCDDGGAAMTADISSPAVFRYLLTLDQSGGKTQTALHAHLKSGGSGTRIYDTGGVRGAYIFTQLAATTLSGNAELVTINAATSLAGTLTVGASAMWAGLDVNLAGSQTITVTTGGLAAGIVVRSKIAETSRWPVGLYVMPNTTSAPIQVGRWVSNTADVTSTAYGHSLRGAATDGAFRYAIGAFCDDGGAVMTADISAPAVFRYLLTVDQSGGKTQTALHAHLKSAGTGTRTYDTGGIRGAYIFNQLAATTLSGNAELVTINAATSLAGTMTVGTGTMWAGVDINLAGSQTITVDGTGIAAGLVVRAKSAETSRWPYGIYIPTGSCDKFFYGATTLTGGNTTTRNLVDLEVTDNTTNSGGYQRGLYVNWTSAGIKTSTAEINAAGIDLTVSANATYVYGLSIYTAQSGNPNISHIAPLSIYADNMGSGTVGAYYGIELGMNATNKPSECAYMRLAGQGGTPDYVFVLEGSPCATYLFKGLNQYPFVKTPGTYTTAEGFVKIWVDGAAYEIPFFTGHD